MSLYDSIKFKVFVSELDLGSRVEYMSDLLRYLRTNLHQVESLNTPEAVISHDRIIFIPTRHDSDIIEENPFRPSLHDYDESSKYEIEEQFYLSHIEEIKEELYSYVSETINSSSWYTDSCVSCLNFNDVSTDLLLKMNTTPRQSITEEEDQLVENHGEYFQDGDHLFNDSQDNPEALTVYSDMPESRLDCVPDIVDIIEDEFDFETSQVEPPQTIDNEIVVDENIISQSLDELAINRIDCPVKQDTVATAILGELTVLDDIVINQDKSTPDSALELLVSSGYATNEDDVAVFKSRVAIFLFFSSSNFAVKYNISKNELFIIEDLLTTFDASNFKSVLRKVGHRLPVGKRIDISRVDVNTMNAVLELMASEA